MARAVFLWHMHQPEYRDPVSGQPLLPWVRLHATRAYSDMAAALEQHPKARVVVNWAPSLLLQLEAYATGRSVDKDEQLARKNAAELTPAERAHVVKESFSVDWELWVRPVPRYAELLGKRGADLRKIDLLQVQSHFTEQELVDLQVHFILAWMGFAARREQPLVAELVKKERGFTHAEKIALLELSRQIATGLIPRWRKLAAQVEFTCSPMYHPILPLLVDTDSARRAMPQAQLPPRFQHPEDAREQVRRGLSRAEKDFGARPVGMWPSEGSVSPEVIELLGQEGVRWVATDQGNLERSELAERPAGALHFQPWLCGEVAMYFRDRELSDMIGFRYAKSDPQSAAHDLLKRIAGAGDGIVTVALDGENAWEHYPRSGELFLDALYAGLDCSVLPRELPRPRARIVKVHSGSWIDSNYRIWIGHPEDNQAWTLLGQARAALEERKDQPGFAEAYTACLAAEGSDWFWWYGDDFTTENAPEFDALFRKNVEQVYRALGLAAPERLLRPIIAPYKDATQARAVVIPPRRLIHPVIDGFSHSYYEWNGAGRYRPGQAIGGSMHQASAVFDQLWYGFSQSELFLRLDPAQGADLRGELRILVNDRALRMPLSPNADCPVTDAAGARCGSGRCGAIVELSVSIASLSLSPAEEAGMLVRLMRDEVEVDRLPRYGELKLEVPDKSFERIHWQV